MRNLKEVRLIPSRESTCHENMAVDEYLIDYYRITGTPVFRLYTWNPAAVSMGRYQSAETVNFQRLRQDRIGLVRRFTGGGGILHDDELTYSFVCSEGDFGCRNLSFLKTFEKLNLFILKMYEGLGLSASYAGKLSSGRRIGNIAPFCFSANEECDIVIGGKKIGGNAQRRERDIIFQHGSIPLNIDLNRLGNYFRDSISFEGFTSLGELLGREVEIHEVAGLLKKSFCSTHSAKFVAGDLTGPELKRINFLIGEKYITERWNIHGTAHEDSDEKARVG